MDSRTPRVFPLGTFAGMTPEGSPCGTNSGVILAIRSFRPILGGASQMHGPESNSIFPDKEFHFSGAWKCTFLPLS